MKIVHNDASVYDKLIESVEIADRTKMDQLCPNANRMREYDLAFAQASKYLLDSEFGPGPYVAAHAEAYQCSDLEAAQAIVAKAEALSNAMAKMRLLRLTALAAIKRAQSFQEADAAVKAFKEVIKEI